MLSKKQTEKLDRMERKYCIGMGKITKAEPHLIKAWGQRYRAIMQQVLLRQGKH